MYNQTSIKQLNELSQVLENIKQGLLKKEHIIYERLLERLHKFTSIAVPQFNNEINEFKLNDSDNEDIYPDSIKNMSDDDDIASISDYETDTDDEEHQESENILNNYDDNICGKLYQKVIIEKYFEI